MTTRRHPSTTPHARFRRAGAALVLAVLAVVVPATAASAHAELISTAPADGSVATAAPTQIALTFSERVEAKLGAIRVLAASGKTVTVGPAGHLAGKSSTIAASLPHLDDDTYVVTWRAISSDSHPVFGSFTFRVGTGPAADTTALRARALAGSHASRGVAVGLGIARWLVFATAAAALGMLAFVAVLWPAGADDTRLRRYVLVALAVLAAASVAEVGFQGAYANAGTLGDIGQWSLWRAILGTRFGEASVARAALALLLAVTIARRPVLLRVSTGKAAAAVAAGCLLGTIAVSGHATTGVQPLLGLVADLGHLTAVSFWIGGLLALVVACRSALTTVEDAKDLARRFSPLALASVGVLVVTGAVQGWRQVGDRAGLSTTYGRLLIGKIALVAAGVLAAWASRRIVRAWRRGADRPDVFAFSRNLIAELVVIATVLVATTALVATQPGRETAGGPTTVELADRDTRITLTIDPARHGTAAFHLFIATPGGALQQVQGATLQLSLPSKGIERLDVPLDAAGANHYTTEVGSVPLAGQWQVRVATLLTDFDERVFTTTVRFR